MTLPEPFLQAISILLANTLLLMTALPANARIECGLKHSAVTTRDRLPRQLDERGAIAASN